MTARTLIKAVITALPDGTGPVVVTGDGPVARALREELAARVAEPGQPATVAVETTGDPGVLARLLTEVDEHGCVVLAGSPPGAPAVLDLYSDLHVRGLSLVGVPDSREEGDVSPQ